MDLRKGDIVVHAAGSPSTSHKLFYVDDARCGNGHPRVAQVSSKMGWGLGLPAGELVVVGHSDHSFTREGYKFTANEMHHFAAAVDEVRRRGYQLNDSWIS